VGENTGQIVQALRAERHDLGRNLDELQEHAKALADWRTHYRRHAGASLAVAFGGGVVLGLLAGGSSGGSRIRRSTADYARSGATLTPSAPPRPNRLAAIKQLADNPRARRQVGDAWDHVLEALIGIASAKAIDLISNMVPGFREEYRSRAGSAQSQYDVPRRAGMAPTP
jgi:hypothetical protein